MMPVKRFQLARAQVKGVVDRLEPSFQLGRRHHHRRRSRSQIASRKTFEYFMEPIAASRSSVSRATFTVDHPEREVVQLIDDSSVHHDETVCLQPPAARRRGRSITAWAVTSGTDGTICPR